MVLPWVTFDSIALYDGDCANGVEPDIAEQVVLSFIVASVMTTTASIVAMLLDQVFDSRGQFRVHAPIRYVRERFLHTAWKKDYAWRPFLDPLIIGFGDQQLVTGYAVLLSGWIKVAENAFEVQGAHFVLILYICALSSSSHLAALITLRKYFRKYKLIAKIRLTLVVVFAVFLLASMIAAICMPQSTIEHEGGTKETQSRAQRLSFLVPLLLIILGFSTALVCILYDPGEDSKGISRASTISGNSLHCLVRRTTDSKLPGCTAQCLVAHYAHRCIHFLFLKPLIAFTVQILLAILSAILVLSQKFAAPSDSTLFCGLQEEEENTWGFGQTLSVVMLLLPAMSACHTYLEGRQDISEGFPTTKD